MKAQSLPRFLNACRRRATDATPVWFMRQAGRYLPEYRRLRSACTMLEACQRPELAAELTLQPLRRFSLDAAILFADILLPVRPLGIRLQFLRDKGPCLEPQVRTAEDVNRLRDFDPGEDLPYVLEAIRLVRRELAAGSGPGRPPIPLIGFAGAPFTLASYLIEGGPCDHYLRTKSLMHACPKTWTALMRKLSRMTVRYLQAQVSAGAQALQLFDSWVGCLSREDYIRFVEPYSRSILEALKTLGVPVIHFGTGTSGFLEDFSAAGGDVIGVDRTIPLDRAWPRLRGRGIQGNLDPALLATAPLPSLKREVRRILGEARGRPGHIFNLGHGILPSTPVDHVEAVADWVHEMSSR